MVKKRIHHRHFFKGSMIGSGLILLFLFFYVNFLVFDEGRAQEFDQDQHGNVHGFAWTDTLGRISLNCNNDFNNKDGIEASESQCGSKIYGVNVNSNPSGDSTISGMAWSDSMGWVCFGAVCEGNPPGGDLGDGTVAKASVSVSETGLGTVTGWARVRNLSDSDGGGWISLRGKNQDNISFGVWIDFNTGKWSRSGWNRYTDGTGLGWVDFNEVYMINTPPQKCETEGEQLPCGSDVGECVPGVKTCQNGVWGLCVGAVGPSLQGEACGDLKDNDCDGSVDENCGPGGCQDDLTMNCGVGICQGKQLCKAGGYWSECAVVPPVEPIPEICDGVDNNCNGLVDEIPNCGFKVTMPQGIYEPLCQKDSKDVFCDGENKGKTLVGTHLHTFEIKISDADANEGSPVSCEILRKVGEPVLKLSGAPLSAKGESSLSYALVVDDLQYITDKPWILKKCQAGYTKLLDKPIFVHANTWTELSQADFDMYRAYDCWLGQPGRYFDNSIKCDFEGDYAFARSMARGMPIELNCWDKADNDSNGFVDCEDRWCKGISYNCLLPCGVEKSTTASPCKKQL